MNDIMKFAKDELEKCKTNRKIEIWKWDEIMDMWEKLYLKAKEQYKNKFRSNY